VGFGVLADANPLAQRALAREQTRGHRLADHHDRRRSRRVARAEVTAGQQPDPHRPEVAREDDARVREGRVAGPDRLDARVGDADVVAGIANRELVDEAGADDARQCRYPLEQ
jgi:hypothetical protein